MKTIESDFSNQIIKSVKNKLGNIFFLSDIALIEFDEGVHVDINNSTDLFKQINDYFGLSKPFGVITNRINSYSVNLLDAELFRQKVKNLCAYAVVSHDLAGKMNAEMENSFCISENINFDSLYTAYYKVHSKVKSQSLFSLN